jgi:hypothetical protein
MHTDQEQSTLNEFRAQRFKAFSRWELLCIAFVLLLLFAPGWYWGMPNEFESDADSPVPLGPLAFVGDYFNPNVSEKYPAVHQVLLLPPYALWLGYYKLTGGLQHISSEWPFGFKDPVHVFSSLIVLSRIVTSLMAVGIILSLGSLPFREFDKRGRLLAMSLIATSGVFVYYARAGNLDVPYVFWWAVSFLLLAKYIFDPVAPTRHLILSAVCSALAIGTKDPAAGLVLGSGLILLLIKRSPSETLGARLRQALIYTAVVFFSYAIAAVLPQPVRWLTHVRKYLLSSPNMTQWIQFENTPSGHFGLLMATSTRLTHVLSPVGMLLALVGLIVLLASRRFRVTAFLLLPIISYYAFFIFNIRFVYERFVIPVAFLLAIIAGIGVSSILGVLKTKKWAYGLASVAIAVIFAYQILYGYLPMTYLQVFDVKAAVASSIASYVPPGSAILWDGQWVNIPNADIYERYQVILPPNAVGITKSMKHAFAPEGSRFSYILSDKPPTEGPGAEELDLLQSWQNPSWVDERIHFNIFPRRYFLYRKRNDSAVLDTNAPSVR